MSQSDLVERISVEALVTPLAAQSAVGMMFSEIADALARVEKVTSGFGTFVTSARAERVGRNPRTGERIAIPASTSVSFKASRGLKDAVS